MTQPDVVSLLGSQILQQLSAGNSQIGPCILYALLNLVRRINIATSFLSRYEPTPQRTGQYEINFAGKDRKKPITNF